MVRSSNKLILALICLGMVLVSCNSAKDDILGNWVECPNSLSKNAKSDSTFSQINFLSDGTFAGTNIPMGAFSDATQQRIDISGTWAIDTTKKDFLGPIKIDLAFKPITDSSYTVYSLLYLTLDHQELFKGVDVPTITFRKTKNECK